MLLERCDALVNPRALGGARFGAAQLPLELLDLRFEFGSLGRELGVDLSGGVFGIGAGGGERGEFRDKRLELFGQVIALIGELRSL